MPRKPKKQVVCEFATWNLFRRDGVYYADGRMNTPNLGKHSLGTRDRDEALAALRELDRRIAVRHDKAQPRPSDTHQEVPITEGWVGYLRHVGRPDVLGGAGAGTGKRYRAVRDKHQPYCAKHGIETWNQVGKPQVVAYGAYLSKAGYSDATVYLECTLLKQVIKWLIEEQRALPESHRVRLSLRRSHESDTYCYSREQIRAIVEWCRGSAKLQWLADVIVALAATGMRVGELASLRWTDVDFDAGLITLADNRHSGRHQAAGAVRRTKGRRTRRVPIHPRVRPVLESLARRPDGRVFSGSGSGPLLPNSTCKIFIREVIEPLKAKFPTPAGEVGFAAGQLHSFRHAFVSQSFLDGASEGEIREWVGHTNSRIVERYRHLRDEDARRKIGRIDFFGDGPAPDNDESKANDVAATDVGHANPNGRGVEQDQFSVPSKPGVPAAK